MVSISILLVFVINYKWFLKKRVLILQLQNFKRYLKYFYNENILVEKDSSIMKVIYQISRSINSPCHAEIRKNLRQEPLECKTKYGKLYIYLIIFSLRRKTGK